MLLALELALFFLAALNLVLACLSGKEIYESRKARKQFDIELNELSERYNTLCEMCFSNQATYTIKELEGGAWIVLRYVYEVSPQLVVIKIFSDEDKEYNKREAQELCDKLNEK